MDKKIRFFSRILFLFLIIGLILGLHSASVDAVSVYSSQTWNTDMEWSVWNRSNIELVGSDSGMRLQSNDNGYARSGTATYRFSPGGTNRWVRASVDSDDAPAVSSKYLWASIYNKDKVVQVNTETAEAVQVWDVGDNPSRTAVGCNNDAWVGNRGVFDTTMDTISHMIPGENRVITRSLGDVSLQQPRAVSIKCVSGGKDEVWVGASGYVIKFYAQDFDNLTENQTIMDIQQGRTLSLNPGQRYGTYGSTFDSNGRFLYIAGYGGGGDVYHRNTYKIDTTRVDEDGYDYEAGWPAISGRYVITNDSQGHVWRDGVCTRISPDGSIDELCTNAMVGITILPSVDGGSEKIAYGKNGNLCVGDLNGNDTDTPSISNLSCTTDHSYSGKENNGTTNISGGGLGYDEDYDIWLLARKAPFMVEWKKSEDYSTGHRYSMAEMIPEVPDASIYSYSDFIGNALSNSTPSRLNIEYSSDGSNYYEANADGSLPDGVSPSENLYIRVSMYGSGTNSPLLRSLSIDYEPESQGNMQIVRKTYSSALARSNDNSEATYERGETVYVRIVINQPGSTESDAILVDRLSNYENPSNYRYKPGCSGSGSPLSPISVGGNEIRFNMDIQSGLSCIDYEYTAQ